MNNRFEESKRKLNIMDFDEVNVLKESIKLYERLYSDCKKEWRNLYADRYIEMWLYLKGKKPDEDELDELVEMEMSRLLYEAHPVTKYIFDSEVLRKRDRMFEDIQASPTKAQKQLAMEKGKRFWAQMTTWYTDFTSQDAELDAIENAWVKKVKRHEMNDDRVCSVCRKLDGTIYAVDKIPPLPHLRCRAWYTPVLETNS